MAFGRKKSKKQDEAYSDTVALSSKLMALLEALSGVGFQELRVVPRMYLRRVRRAMHSQQ